MPEAFSLQRGGLQDRFLQSKAKVQLYGGGFANGKTSAACIKALELARMYPGSNGLIARETRPKLVDTIMKEFTKWCPSKWIKSFPKGVNSSNTCTMTNGTTINFRYIQQQKKGEHEGTSNLLSATYDWIIVDQMEDPGIVEKDFDDLLGRLRGNARYTGSDPDMPQTGPRWFIITCNPTRNWLFRVLVRPLKIYEATGRITPDLLCVRDRDTGDPVLDEHGKPQLMIELFEGATYENAANLGDDFIVLLESRYQGSMRERFLLGQWAAYSGLVYPMYDESLHSISPQQVEEYLWDLRNKGFTINFVEGYDYGIASPSCYGLGFIDPYQNVILADGFYQPEMSIKEQSDQIKLLRDRWGVPHSQMVFADPQTFRRGPGNSQTVGSTVADMFYDEGVPFRRGNNNISSGIVKLQAHLNPFKMHKNPFTGEYNAPHLFHSDHLTWIAEEFSEYVWKTDAKGDLDGDKPIDKKDHAMDMLKYLTTHRPEPSMQVNPHNERPFWTQWHEVPDRPTYRKPQRHHHGRA